jgi:hypothetical protein
MSMSTSMLLPYFALFATLLRALLVKANIAAPTCGRCGYKLERQSLGERVCTCRHK